MYLRRTQRRRKDGSVVGYVQLAHNRRVDGVTRAEGVAEPRPRGRARHGRVATPRGVDREGHRRGRRDRAAGRLGDGNGGAAHDDGGLEVDSSRALGGVWLLDALWRRLGVPDALARVLGPRRFTTDVERVLFAMVANRALEPCSKLACSEWAVEDVAID